MTDASQHSLPSTTAGAADFRLGPWLVQPPLNRISGPGGEHTLEPRMMHVLVCLAADPGRLLTRQELLETVWHDAIVGEEALTRSVSRLRDAFGDESKAPRFIETIRGGGYRLLTAPEPVGDAPAPAGTEMSGDEMVAPPTSAEAPPLRGKRSWTLLIRLVAPMLLVGAMVITTSIMRSRVAKLGPGVLVTRPFTTYAHSESYPNMAPDGISVVFTWSGPDGESTGLFIKQPDTETPLRLTESPGYDYHPAFSPDGATVAFVRSHDGGRGLYTVPAIGGPPSLLAELTSPVFGLTWSPDGAALVYAGIDPSDNVSRLRRLDVATRETTPLTWPDLNTHTGDSWPQFSPSGDRVAFARCDHAGLREVYVVPAVGGDEVQITHGMNDIQGIAWLAGGEELIVSASPGGSHQLWRVRLSDGYVAWQPTTARGETIHPTVSAAGDLLVFRSQVSDYNIQMLPLLGADGRDLAPQPLVTSTRNDSAPAWSVNGDRVAFVSDRSGHPEMWVCNTDGSELRQLTHLEGPDIGQLRWSPDDQRILITTVDAWLSQVQVVEVAGGVTTPATLEERHQRGIGWSADSRWLYVTTDIGDRWHLQRVSPDGTIIENLLAQSSSRQQFKLYADHCYWTEPDTLGIWRFVPPDGAIEQVIPPEAMAGWRLWAPGSDCVFFVKVNDEGSHDLGRHSLAGGEETYLGGLPAQRYVNLQVSRDESTALVTVLERIEADLMLVEGLK